MTNTNPETGIRYGYIACDSLNQDLVHNLFYGPQAKDLGYEVAYADAKVEAQREYANLIEEADISAADSGADRQGDFDRERSQEMWFEFKGHEYDEETFVNGKLEWFSDLFENNEPTIEGEYKGVKYRVSWLGGAANLFIFEGPIVRARSLCSPCVPGAIDLNSKFIYAGLSYDDSVEARYSYQGYGVPADWLASATTD